MKAYEFYEVYPGYYAELVDLFALNEFDVISDEVVFCYLVGFCKRHDLDCDDVKEYVSNRLAKSRKTSDCPF